MRGTANVMQQRTWVGRQQTIMVNLVGSNEAAAVARSLLTVCQSSTTCVCVSSASAEAWAAAAASLGRPASMRLHRTRSDAVRQRAWPTVRLSSRRPSMIRCDVWRTHGGVSSMAAAGQGAPPKKKLRLSTSNAHQGSLGQCTTLCVLQACVNKPASMGDRLHAQSP